MAIHMPAEITASTLLDRDGIAAIWHLQVAAAAVYRTGDPIAAASILEIAEAAERECFRQETQLSTER